MPICVRGWSLIWFGLALCGCTAPRNDSEDDSAADAGVELAHDPGPRSAAEPRLSARLAPPTPSLGGGLASDTCLVDTSMADFQAGTLTGCDAATTPGDVTLLSGPLLDQQQLAVTTSGFGFNATSWAGQTFIPVTTGPLTRIDLDLFCSGCSGSTPNLTLSIRATTGTPALPTGADLATATITGFNNGGGGFFTASFATPLTVTAGTTYALVLRASANPSSGTYAYLCSCNSPNSNPYVNGQRVTSSNSGASWTADVNTGGRDLGFKIFIGNGFPPTGTLASSAKDANPAVGEGVHWTTLSWTGNAPTNTTLQFQVASASASTGPFSFVGPDGTAGTFFSSGDSLAQFDGNSFLEYKAFLATSDSNVTPVVQDVTTCFHNSPTTVTTALAVNPASGPFGGTVDLTAVLTGGGLGLSGKTVSFTFNGAAAGDVTTDATGTATVTGASLTGLEPGTYPGVVIASYAGETGITPSSGSSDLTVTQAAQVIAFAVLPDKVMTASAFTVSATGGASGNPVTFSTSSTACSVTDTTVTLVSAGTCAIQADQAGNTQYAAATPVTRTFTISLATQDITFPAIASFSWSGGSATLAASASSGLAVAYGVQSGPCSIAGTTLTATATGTCVVAADQSGDGTYSAAPQVTASATVTQAGQTITFAALSDKTMTDAAFTVSATGGGSGNPVTFSTTSTACSVTGSTVTLVSAGTCAIQADQAGDANYEAAAPVTQSFTISLATQDITFPAITSFSWSGGSATLAATASSGLVVAYSVESGPCSIAGTTLTATAAGSCVVAADQAGDGIYSAAPQVTATATVTRASQAIGFAALSNKQMTDPAFTVGATGGGSGNPVTFSTTSTACSVTGSTVTLVSAGACAIQADQAGNANYNAATPVTQSFTISLASQEITFPTIASFSWLGGSATLAATATSGLAIAYSVQTGPCSVSGTTLTATTAGICTVAANQAGNGTYAAATQVLEAVVVTRASQSLAFPAIPSFSWGGGSGLAATASSGLAVAYSVQSGPCSVSGTTLTASATGTCVVAADQPGNVAYLPATQATSSVTISTASQTITFPPIASFTWSGGSATLTATASSALAVAYSVQSGPCSISGTTLTATAAGPCVVAADQAGNSNYASAAPVTATATVTRADQTIAFSALADRQATDPALTVDATGGASSSPVTFSTSSTACSVSGTTVTLISAGSCAIQANQAGDANYNAATPVTQTFSISIVAQAITFPEITEFLWHGGSATLAATASSTLAITYLVISGPCSVAGSTLTAATGGTCVVAADQAGDGRYDAAPQVTASVTVTRAEQTITFPAIPIFPANGGSAKLTAKASSGLPVTYAVQSGPCVLDGVTLTSTAPGTCVVTANQPGDSGYNAAPPVTATVTTAETDNGCGCHSTNPNPASVMWIVLVIVGLRRAGARQRRAARRQ